MGFDGEVPLCQQNRSCFLFFVRAKWMLLMVMVGVAVDGGGRGGGLSCEGGIQGEEGRSDGEKR